MYRQVMDIRGWDERYRSGERTEEDLDAPPTPLVIETASGLRPGRALDLASGTGRNALWLARRGWEVTAVDGAPAGIDILRARARRLGLTVNAEAADLQTSEFPIEPKSWDLIAICYYLQRDLFEPAKAGVKPSGTLLAIVHTTEAGEEPTASRLRRGELKRYFGDWEILHHYEGASRDPAHRRPVAEIVARRPPESKDGR